MRTFQVEIDAPVILTIETKDETEAETLGDMLYARAYEFMARAVAQFAAESGADIQLGNRYDNTEVTEVDE